MAKYITWLMWYLVSWHNNNNKTVDSWLSEIAICLCRKILLSQIWKICHCWVLLYYTSTSVFRVGLRVLCVLRCLPTLVWWRFLYGDLTIMNRCGGLLEAEQN
jgi:hypothetical protein